MQNGTDRNPAWGLTARLRAFAADESGAATVDWVVLTGAAVGFSFAVFTSINDGLMAIGTSIETSLSQANVKALDNLEDLYGGET